MMLDFVECRVTNPVKFANWGEVEEAQRALCLCCGWAGRLGECEIAAEADSRTYACARCSMVLVARAFPRVIPVRFIRTVSDWRASDLLAVNL